jgi:hypothetical protein
MGRKGPGLKPLLVCGRFRGLKAPAPFEKTKTAVFQNRIFLFAGVFGFGVGLGEVGVGVFQHFVLIAVA